MKMALLVILTTAAVWPIESAKAAPSFRVNNRCYGVRLAGAMVDTFECKQVVVNVLEYNCKTFQRKGDPKKHIATLGGCKENRANALVNISGKVFGFKVVQADSVGIDAWEIRVKALKKRVKRKVVRVKPKPLPRPIIKTTTIKMFDGVEPHGHLDVIMGGALAGQDVNGSPGSSLAEDTESHRITDLYSTGVTIDRAEVGMVIGESGDEYSGRVSFAYGPGFREWDSSVFAQQLGQDFGVTELYMQKNEPKGYLRFGKFESPLLNNGRLRANNRAVGHPFYSLYGLPHLHVGISYRRKLNSKWTAQGLLANGWNRDVSVEDSPSLGLGGEYRLRAGTKLRLQVYAGKDTSQLVKGAFHVVQMDGDAWLGGKWNIYFGYLLGQFDKFTDSSFVGETASWSGWLVQIKYLKSMKWNFSLGVETFSNNKGFLFSDERWAEVMSSHFTVKRRSSESFQQSFELRTDMPLKNVAGQDPDDNRISALVALHWNM